MAIEAAQTGWSDDGNWFWDGARWNDAVSEDSKWRFDGNSWHHHVEVLAADNMEGRLTGSPGLQRAGFGIDGDVAAEDHQRRYRPDIELLADHLLIVGIDLREQNIGVPGRGGGKGRRERATRRVPWRPEIDDCKWMAVDRRFEILFGEFDNARGVGRHLDGCQTSLIFRRLKGFVQLLSLHEVQVDPARFRRTSGF